jgi:hypothetical protein
MESMIHGRWPYWLAMLGNGRLGSLPEWAIPQIHFDSIESGADELQLASAHGPFQDEPRSQQIIDHLATRSEARRACERAFSSCFSAAVPLSDAITWWLWAFGSPRIESKPELPDHAERSLLSLPLHQLIAHPGDWAAFIATLYFGEKGGKHCAWFPTPVSVGTLMVQTTFANCRDEDTRPMSVHDPCVGTGALLLPASNYSLNLSGQDIDRTMCLLCEWQGWLFMPWTVFGSKNAIREIRERNNTQRAEAA